MRLKARVAEKPGARAGEWNLTPDGKLAGTGKQEVPPETVRQAGPFDRLDAGGVSEHERLVSGKPSGELRQAPQAARIDISGLDVDGPRSPTPVDDPVHLQWFFAPVPQLLAGVPGVCQAGVSHPGSKARRIGRGVGRPLRVERREQCVAERNQFRRRCALTNRPGRELRDSGNEVRVFEQCQIAIVSMAPGSWSWPWIFARDTTRAGW